MILPFTTKSFVDFPSFNLSATFATRMFFPCNRHLFSIAGWLIIDINIYTRTTAHHSSPFKRSRASRATARNRMNKIIMASSFIYSPTLCSTIAISLARLWHAGHSPNSESPSPLMPLYLFLHLAVLPRQVFQTFFALWVWVWGTRKVNEK